MLKQSSNDFWQEVEATANKQIASREELLSAEVALLDEKLEDLPDIFAPLVTEENYGFKAQSNFVISKKQERDIKQILKQKERVNEERQRCLHFSQEQADFSAKLQRLGIAHKTIISKALFDGLSKKSKSLFAFEHLDQFGNTGVGGHLFLLPVLMISSIVCLVYVALTLLAFKLIFHESAIIYILSLLLSCGGFLSVISSSKTMMGQGASKIGFVIGLICASLVLYILTKEPWTILFILLGASSVINSVTLLDESSVDVLSKLTVKLMSHHFIISSLFPLHHDENPKSNEDSEEDIAVKVSFIDAPKDFMQSLQAVRKANLQPCILADFRAISIKRNDLVKVLKKLIKADPILYIYSDKSRYVAIVNHFGDFPEEKKLLKYVKKNGLKLSLN